MKPKDIFMLALHREPVPRPATGSATSIVTVDLMKKVGVYFPDAHLDAKKMATLAGAGYTEIGFDNVMPLFSVCHESSALGCKVDWGVVDRMPDCRGGIYKIDDDITIPRDFLTRSECKVPLDALRILKHTYGDEIAIVGKVFGPWTLGYHLFGVEEFLINTLLKRDSVKRALETLKEVTVAFARAQIDAGVDALCLADHATRDLCSPGAYKDFLMGIHQELNDRIPCPLILHICGDTSDRIGFIAQTGIKCFHFDSKVPALQARELAGSRLSLMGGTSNFNVILNVTQEIIEKDVNEKIACNIDIIGPECAVPLNAPFSNLRFMTELVKKN